MVTQMRLTLQQFLAMPDIDERRLELIDGEVYKKVSPRWGHARLAIELGLALRPFGHVGAEPRAIVPGAPAHGPSAPLPDLALYRDAPPKSAEWMTQPPDLVVEFLSIGQSRSEVRTKVDVYLTFGVRTVWVFDTERESVDVYEGGNRLTASTDDILTGLAVPGFAKRVDEIYRDAGYEPADS
ncbi:MAG: Uma2 family endonuclease [Tepidiformaceae bacterium]